MAFIISILKRIWNYFFGSGEKPISDQIAEGIQEEVSKSKHSRKGRQGKYRKPKSTYRWRRFFGVMDKKSANASQLALARAHFGNFRPIQPFRVRRRAVKNHKG